MVLGVDPGWILDQPLDDLPIVEQILREAGKLRAGYDESLAEAIASRTAARLLPGLSKQLTRLIAALARSRRI